MLVKMLKDWHFLSVILVALFSGFWSLPIFSNVLTASDHSPLEQKLLQKYTHIKELRAEVSQEKTGEFLAVPLKSTARISWSKEKVVWTNLTPVPSEILLTEDQVVITKPDGTKVTFSRAESRSAGPFLQQPQKSSAHNATNDKPSTKRGGSPDSSEIKRTSQVMTHLTQFLASLFALDLAALRKDFVIESKGSTILAKKKPESDFPLFNSFELQFGDTLLVESLSFRNENSQTLMRFSGVSLN